MRLSHTGQDAPNSPRCIGAAVRQARRAHGLTQTQLAGLAGTGLRFISELERGKPTVALDKTLAVLAVLGLRFQVSAVDP
jgi:HTH-type transcriptional regulator/antitoxin HipB